MAIGRIKDGSPANMLTYS